MRQIFSERKNINLNFVEIRMEGDGELSVYVPSAAKSAPRFEGYISLPLSIDCRISQPMSRSPARALLGKGRLGKTTLSFVLLVLFLWWWSFLGCCSQHYIFPGGAHSFVLVVPSSPSQHYYYYYYYYPPWSSLAHPSGSKIYSSTAATSALFLVRKNSGDDQSRNNPSIAINKKLVELGKKRRWKDLLEVFEEEQARFNNVNYATLMNQLGRIRTFDKADPRFVACLQALAAKIEQRGLPWVQTRQASNIVHAIGKMKLRNPGTKRILEWIQPEVAVQLRGGWKSS